MGKAGYDITVHGLLRKRAELLRSLEIKRDELAAVHNDITAVERALELFDYQGELEPPRARVLKDIRRELRRFILDELRKGEPLTSRDLAKKLAALEGKNTDDKKAIAELVSRVSRAITTLVDRQTLRRIKTQGIRECQYCLVGQP